jgi:predicted nucleic acid-binding Zn ribbon protein
MSDSVKRKCPKCAKNKLERLIGTGAGVLFRGSGFYETDYRSDSYKKGAESEQKPASGDAKKSSDSNAGTSSNGESASKSPPASKPDTTSKSDS